VNHSGDCDGSGRFLAVWLLPALALQLPSDLMQVVGGDGQAHVAGKVVLGAIRAPVQPAMLQLVDVGLDGAVFVFECFEGRGRFKGFFGLATLAFLRHNHLRNPDLQLRFITHIREAFIHTQVLFGVFWLQTPGNLQGQLAVSLPLGQLPVDHQVVLIAGDGQFFSKLHAGVALAFFDELGLGQKMENTFSEWGIFSSLIRRRYTRSMCLPSI